MKAVRQFALFISLAFLLTPVFAAAVNVKVIALFTNKALLNIGGEQKLLTKGDEFKGVTLISATGRGAVISIGDKQSKISLNQLIQGNFKAVTRTNSRIYPDSNGMYFVQGKINGHATRFLVDTGATFVTMSTRHAKAVGIDFRKGTRSSTKTATTTVPTWQVKLRSITVGGIKLHSVEASVINGAQPGTVLLGNSFLSRTELQRKGTVMELHKRF